MFESIAMICYLSMVEPQEIQPSWGESNPKLVLEVYTGGNGGEPEDDEPDVTKRE
ncbi:hypothetical protein [Kangiella sediminilitoris]|uniref:Uncharacterized protein n=1 Tax=Kangiella sediminilitoris TaxID=1144748 RepID=A0A1B3BBL9_9GAMM|nr:hypothetical protein [Kangiella sediminilitoris]AOE50182.1 hypothetical protein KS2013_1470 [Kangiella sediminilitoris]